jgi:hypothetical protein
LLMDVSQDMTQWSAVYDMNSGHIDVVMGGEYENIFSFQLSMKQR